MSLLQSEDFKSKFYAKSFAVEFGDILFLLHKNWIHTNSDDVWEKSMQKTSLNILIEKMFIWGIKSNLFYILYRKVQSIPQDNLRIQWYFDG